MKELVIDTNCLCFSYKNGVKDVEDLELKVPKGSIYGFLGPNGAGKSTTIRLLLRLLHGESGDVFLFGELFNGKSRLRILNKIGALIESPSLYEHLSARDNLRITANYRKNIPISRINEVLEDVKLHEVGNKQVKEFSLGMKQRLGVATALLSSPELIILDEPTNGLDPKGIIEMRNTIRNLNTKYGTTVLISSHLLSEIERTCTHVGIIKDGKMLYQNTVSALKKTKVENVKVRIEVDNVAEGVSVLTKLGIENVTLVENHIEIVLNSKSEVTEIIDMLRAEKINIYQVVINNSLEELFLSLTENNKI